MIKDIIQTHNIHSIRRLQIELGIAIERQEHGLAGEIQSAITHLEEVQDILEFIELPSDDRPEPNPNWE